MDYERHKTENAAIKQQLDTINIKTESLLPDEEYTAKTEALKAKEKQLTPLEQQIEQLNKNLDLKEAVQKQEEAIKSLNLKKAETAKKLERFEAERGMRLRQHERVAPLTDAITNWQKTLQKEEENAKEQQKTQRETKQLEEDITKLKIDIFSFIKQETDDTKIPAALSDFAKKVDVLQKKLNDKRTRHKNLTELFKTEMKAADFSLSKNTVDDLARLETLENTTSEKIERLKSAVREINLDTPDAEKKRLNQEIKELHEAFRHQEKINQLLEKITGFQKELKTNESEGETLPAQIKETQQKIDVLTEKLKRQQTELDNQKLRASLEEHRAHLVDGTPCPLCGALEHPFADNLPDRDNSLQTAIAQTDQELQTVTKANIQLRSKLELLDKNSTKLKRSIENEETGLDQLRERSPFALSDKAALSEDLFKEKMKNQENQLENLDHWLKLREQQEAILKGKPLLNELQEIREEGITLKRELDALFKGEDVYTATQKLQNQWTALAEKKSAFAKNLQELNQKNSAIKAELNTIENALKPKVNALEFEEIAQAAQAILPHQIHTQLRSEKEELVGQKATMDASLNTLDIQLKDFKKRDVEEDRESLSKKITEHKQQLTALRADNEKLRRSIANHNDTLKEISILKTEIASREKQIRRWYLLNELIGDATGKKFNEFAQDLTLSQLLKHGNRRLADLSDRYLMDKPIEGEDDGLVAIDKHMGGQRRSVKTLSGGETFILSLSMAPALSDLASRHVEINSLFIDEGFGTLDPETLEQTLDTLERLEAESSKTIGIISHVESLKERIAAQIQLKRHGQGYSTLSIK